MKVLIDMNLSPDWVTFFSAAGIQARHWITIGEPNAPDEMLMSWATENNYVVFTHDLDFGALLATSQASSPSVLQVRSQDTFYENIGAMVLAAIRQFESELNTGAIVTVDANKARVRILPFRRA